MSDIIFTPSGLLELLTQIDELSDVNVGISETVDGDLQLQVGQSTYLISTEEASEVSVDESTVDTIDDIDIATYESLESSGEVELSDEPIEGGLIKSIAKTLLLGGMVKLTAKLLK